MRLAYFILLSCLVITSSVAAFDEFIIEDIRLDGLRRTSPGTVFNYLPLKTNDRLTAQRSQAAIAALYKTGLFQDVKLHRDGRVLVVELFELPIISSINFTGNKAIDTDELSNALKSTGFATGRVFNRSLLDKVELELQRQYFGLGKYAVKIQSTVTPLDRHRVGIQIDVSEGVTAKIKQINIVGNEDFDDDTLLDQMSLSTGGWFTFFTNSDQYNKQKLTADLETINAYYQDRGYVTFQINSTQVAITPDKKDIYLTINVTEGEQYTLKDIQLVGNLIVAEDELRKHIRIKPGEIFSRKKVSASVEAVSNRIGDEGYYFVNINPIPDIDRENKQIALRFFVEPGKRTYVRRINFSGNLKTHDVVLRREMRQMEGAWIAIGKVKRSKERLERLSFIEKVELDTTRVPNTTDQVDLNFDVTEQHSGNFLAGAGYSQSQGFLVNASVTFDNFLGTGRQISTAFNNSQIVQTYSLSYYDPYVNIDGVSRYNQLYYRATDAEQANLSRYSLDAIGFNWRYGIPISEHNSVYAGLEYERTVLEPTESSAQEVFDFVQQNDDTYNTYRLSLSWARDTRNRALLPERGTLQSLSAEVTVPIGDLDYYKLSYKHQWLYPLAKDYILMLQGQASYGDGFGDTETLPFFENYTAGGPRSVRGYRENSLGPQDSRERAIGGNMRFVANAELILPVPFAVNVRSFRLSAFVDAGNVFNEEDGFKTDELRYSTGLSALWLSPLGVIRFSYARPWNDKPEDSTQAFQFLIGTTF